MLVFHTTVSVDDKCSKTEATVKETAPYAELQREQAVGEQKKAEL